jgi:hypothetical protein
VLCPFQAQPLEIQIRPIDRFILVRPQSKENDSVIDRMCSGIREFGFPVSREGDLWLCGPHRVLCGDADQRGNRDLPIGRSRATYRKA